jgi:hypothetical protein
VVFNKENTLLWDELTEFEQENARKIYDGGLDEEHVRSKYKNSTVQLQTLRAALQQLSPEAENMLLTESEVASLYEGHELKYTTLAMLEKRLTDQLAWLEIPGNGRPSQHARHAVIAYLKDLWIARGGDPATGRLQNDNADREPLSPNAFNRFLACCLMELDDKTRDFETACRRANSALRALGREK